MSVSGLQLRALSIAVLALALIGCDKAEGVAAVEALCAKDGGAHVYETTFVNGYLDPYGSARCIACKDYLPKGAFEYIDVYVEEGKGYGEIGGLGYYRYSLGEVGDARCEPFESDRTFQQTKASWGFSEEQCLAVERIAGTDAAEFSWTRRSEPISVDDVTITSDEVIVFHVESGRVLARHQDYAFTSKITRFVGSITSGGSNPDVRCGRGPWVGTTDLLQRVLRDRQKANAIN